MSRLRGVGFSAIVFASLAVATQAATYSESTQRTYVDAIDGVDEQFLASFDTSLGTLNSAVVSVSGQYDGVVHVPLYAGDAFALSGPITSTFDFMIAGHLSPTQKTVDVVPFTPTGAGFSAHVQDRIGASLALQAFSGLTDAGGIELDCFAGSYYQQRTASQFGTFVPSLNTTITFDYTPFASPVAAPESLALVPEPASFNVLGVGLTTMLVAVATWGSRPRQPFCRLASSKTRSCASKALLARYWRPKLVSGSARTMV